MTKTKTMTITKVRHNEERELVADQMRELIMDNPIAQGYVDKKAEEYMQHFLTTSKIGAYEIMQEVYDELLCQYQVQVWHQLFHEIGF